VPIPEQAPIQIIVENFDLYPKQLGKIDDIKVVIIDDGKVIPIITSHSRGYLYIRASAFKDNQEIYPPIIIASSSPDSMVSNPSLLRLANGDLVFIWHEFEPIFSEISAINAVLVKDNPYQFAHGDAAYNRYEKILFENLSDDYVVSLCNDGNSFVIASCNDAGYISLKTFNSQFSLISSHNTDILFINKQQQIIPTNNGFILFYNDPESGIRKITYDQALNQIEDSEIVIDVVAETPGFTVIKSNEAILLTCDNNGIKAIAFDLNGVVKEGAKVITITGPGYSLISSSEVKSKKELTGGSLNIIENQGGDRYAFFLDENADRWGEKFQIDNVIEQIIPYPNSDDNLILRFDRYTSIENPIAQIAWVNRGLVPSFSPSNAISPTSTSSENSFSQTLSALPSDSASPIISFSSSSSPSPSSLSPSPSFLISFFSISASIASSPSPSQIASASYSSDNEDVVGAGEIIAMTVILTIVALAIAMVSRYFYLRTRRDGDNGVEMMNFDHSKPIKDFLLEKQGYIVTKSTSKHESEKFALIKNLLDLAIKYKEINKLEDQKFIEFSFDQDNNIFVQMKLEAPETVKMAEKYSICLIFKVNGDDSSLSSVNICLYNNFITFESDNKDIFDSKFKSRFSNQHSFINNLLSLMIKVNMQMIDYSAEPNKQGASFLSHMGYVKSRVNGDDSLNSSDVAHPSSRTRVKIAAPANRTCLMM
jgi:hypothetical protein